MPIVDSPMDAPVESVCSTLILTPAYGRDYPSEYRVLAAWYAGRDFRVSTPYGSSYANISDVEHLAREYRAIRLKFIFMGGRRSVRLDMEYATDDRRNQVLSWYTAPHPVPACDLTPREESQPCLPSRRRLPGHRRVEAVKDPTPESSRRLDDQHAAVSLLVGAMLALWPSDSTSVVATYWKVSTALVDHMGQSRVRAMVRPATDDPATDDPAALIEYVMGTPEGVGYVESLIHRTTLTGTADTTTNTTNTL